VNEGTRVPCINASIVARDSPKPWARAQTVSEGPLMRQTKGLGLGSSLLGLRLEASLVASSNGEVERPAAGVSEAAPAHNFFAPAAPNHRRSPDRSNDG
jgi:hypothetical protein